MKRTLFFCILLLIGVTSAMSQIVTHPEGPPIDLPFIRYATVDTPIEWEENGMGYATATLPFSLDKTVDLAVKASLVYTYKAIGNTLEFTFFSATPKINHVTLEFEDEDFSFGYTNTSTVHEYFMYKWKYIIDIYFQ